MGKIGIIVLVFVIGFAGLFISAGDLGGEVVHLTTYDESGRAHETSLWVVDDNKQLWIRAGQPESAWLLRLEEHPLVGLSREGTKGEYRAVVVPRQRVRINRLMAERYGWADQLIGLVRDAEATSAIRLDPIR